MVDITENTEEKILQAAEIIFLRDGYSGSRMQDIANLAGINKAMLHYYFRSKDKLFEHIFDKKSKILFPQIEGFLESDVSFLSAVEKFIDIYFGILLANPFLPLFIISTVNNPEREDFLEKIPTNLNKKFALKYYDDKAKGIVSDINPMQFVISIMSMCIFPFMAKPLIKKTAGFNDEQFDQFMQMRISELKKYANTILNA